MMRKFLSLFVGSISLAGTAQEAQPNRWPQVHGTIRAKYEYQTQESEQRFDVRNARVAFTGTAMPNMSYKCEADFCDEGKFKVLDVFGEWNATPYIAVSSNGRLSFRMGQFRVPFSLEPHRSPHLRFFANRSFLAKQMGNVRDIGFMASYERPFGENQDGKFSIKGGLFNGSGLTEHKNYWTKGLNYSARAELSLPCGLSFSTSTMRMTPLCGHVYLYDGVVAYRRGTLLLEGEYMTKHYARNKFSTVDAVNFMAIYDIPFAQPRSDRPALFESMSLRARYDSMDNHSDGHKLDASGAALLSDVERRRITAGVNFRFAQGHSKSTFAELRLNYEKYFYDSDKIIAAKPSERDKAVVELVVRF